MYFGRAARTAEAAFAFMAGLLTLTAVLVVVAAATPAVATDYQPTSAIIESNVGVTRIALPDGGVSFPVSILTPAPSGARYSWKADALKSFTDRCEVVLSAGESAQPYGFTTYKASLLPSGYVTAATNQLTFNFQFVPGFTVAFKELVRCNTANAATTEVYDVSFQFEPKYSVSTYFFFDTALSWQFPTTQVAAAGLTAVGADDIRRNGFTLWCVMINDNWYTALMSQVVIKCEEQVSGSTTRDCFNGIVSAADYVYDPATPHRYGFTIPRNRTRLFALTYPARISVSVPFGIGLKGTDVTVVPNAGWITVNPSGATTPVIQMYTAGVATLITSGMLNVTEDCMRGREAQNDATCPRLLVLNIRTAANTRWENLVFPAVTLTDALNDTRRFMLSSNYVDFALIDWLQQLTTTQSNMQARFTLRSMPEYECWGRDVINITVPPSAVYKTMIPTYEPTTWPSLRLVVTPSPGRFVATQTVDITQKDIWFGTAVVKFVLDGESWISDAPSMIMASTEPGPTPGWTDQKDTSVSRIGFADVAASAALKIRFTPPDPGWPTPVSKWTVNYTTIVMTFARSPEYEMYVNAETVYFTVNKSWFRSGLDLVDPVTSLPLSTLRISFTIHASPGVFSLSAGTATSIIETNIVDGGTVLVLQLMGDKWVDDPDGGGCRPQLCASWTSNSTDTNGWNNPTVQAEACAAGTMVLLSARVLQVTLLPSPTYNTRRGEVITLNVPAVCTQKAIAPESGEAITILPQNGNVTWYAIVPPTADDVDPLDLAASTWLPLSSIALGGAAIPGVGISESSVRSAEWRLGLSLHGDDFDTTDPDELAASVYDALVSSGSSARGFNRMKATILNNGAGVRVYNSTLIIVTFTSARSFDTAANETVTLELSPQWVTSERQPIQDAVAFELYASAGAVTVLDWSGYHRDPYNVVTEDDVRWGRLSFTFGLIGDQWRISTTSFARSFQSAFFGVTESDPGTVVTFAPPTQGPTTPAPPTTEAPPTTTTTVATTVSEANSTTVGSTVSSTTSVATSMDAATTTSSLDSSNATITTTTAAGNSTHSISTSTPVSSSNATSTAASTTTTTPAATNATATGAAREAAALASAATSDESSGGGGDDGYHLRAAAAASMATSFAGLASQMVPTPSFFTVDPKDDGTLVLTFSLMSTVQYDIALPEYVTVYFDPDVVESGLRPVFVHPVTGAAIGNWTFKVVPTVGRAVLSGTLATNEKRVREGNLMLYLTLLGETWNATVVRSLLQTGITVASAVSNGETGFAALKTDILPISAITVVSTTVVSLQLQAASKYQLSGSAETVQFALPPKAVTSWMTPSSRGALELTVAQSGGEVVLLRPSLTQSAVSSSSSGASSASNLIITEEDVRKRNLTISISLRGASWNIALINQNPALFVSTTFSSLSSAIAEPNGFLTHKNDMLGISNGGRPSYVFSSGSNAIDIRIFATPAYEVAQAETITATIPSQYVVGLAPDPSTVSFTVSAVDSTMVLIVDTTLSMTRAYRTTPTVLSNAIASVFNIPAGRVVARVNTTPLRDDGMLVMIAYFVTVDAPAGAVTADTATTATSVADWSYVLTNAELTATFLASGSTFLTEYLGVRWAYASTASPSRDQVYATPAPNTATVSTSEGTSSTTTIALCVAGGVFLLLIVGGGLILVRMQRARVSIAVVGGSDTALLHYSKLLHTAKEQADAAEAAVGRGLGDADGDDNAMYRMRPGVGGGFDGLAEDGLPIDDEFAYRVRRHAARKDEVRAGLRAVRTAVGSIFGSAAREVSGVIGTGGGYDRPAGVARYGELGAFRDTRVAAREQAARLLANPKWEGRYHSAAAAPSQGQAAAGETHELGAVRRRRQPPDAPVAQTSAASSSLRDFARDRLRRDGLLPAGERDK